MLASPEARAGRTRLVFPCRTDGKLSLDGWARQLLLIQQRKVTREGRSGSRAARSGAGRAGTGLRSRTESRSARRLSSPGLVLLNFPRRDSIGRSPLVQIITLSLPPISPWELRINLCRVRGKMSTFTERWSLSSLCRPAEGLGAQPSCSEEMLGLRC